MESMGAKVVDKVFQVQYKMNEDDSFMTSFNSYDYREILEKVDELRPLMLSYLAIKEIITIENTIKEYSHLFKSVNYRE